MVHSFIPCLKYNATIEGSRFRAPRALTPPRQARFLAELTRPARRAARPPHASHRAAVL